MGSSRSLNTRRHDEFCERYAYLCLRINEGVCAVYHVGMLRVCATLHSEDRSMRFFVGFLCGIGFVVFAGQIMQGVSRITGCGIGV